METILQAEIIGSAIGHFFCSTVRPDNEPHPKGIQRKTPRKVIVDFGLRIENREESGSKGPGFGLPPEEALMLFPLLRQSAGVMEHCKISNSKHRISGFQVSGVSFQVLGAGIDRSET
jgi:hypothetical protein